MALATASTPAALPPAPPRPALPARTAQQSAVGTALAQPQTMTARAAKESREELLAPYSPMQRVAALLIALGPEASTAVFKHLREEDVEAITVELFRMRTIPSKITDAVIEDIFELVVATDAVESGGLEYAQDLIRRTFGAERAQELLNRIAVRAKRGPFDYLREIDPSQLVSFLQPEHPQTIALVLCHMGPEQAALILTGLAPEVQADVATRIATMDRTAPEVVREVDRLLKQKLSNLGTQSTQQVGGVKQLVSLLNAADVSRQKSIVEVLDEQQPELAEEIKKNMFVFEDLNGLSDRDIQRLCRELDTKELALALRGASDYLKDRIVAKGMSARAGQQLREDIELMGPQRLSAIEEAQQKIVAVVRRLEQAEEITISRGGSDEFK